MRILSIETSCDETAVSILECTETATGTNIIVLGNALLSQIDMHKDYGGVYPMLAKRAHAANLVPLLLASLEEAEMLHEDTQALSDELRNTIGTVLEREPGLSEAFLEFALETERPDIDAIAVTYGPGLEPALWVGVNFARALSYLWNIPVIGVNHLEGHILSSLLVVEGENEFSLKKPALPLVSLVISGGHTELVLTKEWLAYEKIGETRDDAVGEAYDKVARMLGLPYPGGPEVSKLATEAREANLPRTFTLPRPMKDSNDLDFSFSGLKTAVMYLIKSHGELSLDEKRALAREFEDAVADVLWTKAEKAMHATNAASLVLGGGVSANSNIRNIFKDRAETTLYVPDRTLTGDNAIMIGIAGYFRRSAGYTTDVDGLGAQGNLSLA
ncbi:MAG TPA: tRNA (adenosine(37)-N6)-threonylcarbamoyltransferase complex transferase subunit TsaD [Candidatus Paceibacterota bacterium]|nr:tRNA (adenosine(37)-N6)-threonylcarbamoyltransferase complex transferase subunit TsaD [Candidatus Paceibacterota bacterium]